MAFSFNGKRKPVPVPVPSSPVPGTLTRISILAAVMVVMIIIAAVVSRNWPVPSPVPSNDFFRLGQSYRIELGRAYAPAWETGAAALERGEPVDKALDAVALEWENKRLQIFKQHLSPKFELILPKGTEPTRDQRSMLAAAWVEFSKGLK